MILSESRQQKKQELIKYYRKYTAMPTIIQKMAELGIAKRTGFTWLRESKEGRK